MAANISGLVDHAIQVADDAQTKALDYARTAQTSATAVPTGRPIAPIAVAPIVAPPFNPNQQLATQFGTDFSTQWAGLDTWIQGLMNNWMTTHFPYLDPAIATAENTWLLNVVNNGYIGIPAAVEQAMWDKARGKEMIEALRMEEEAVGQLAARGFSLPPGVLTNRMQVVQQAASDKSSTIARDQAIKQVEISIEMTKFAIAEMTKLRLGIAQALADFIRAFMELPKAAAEIAKAKSMFTKHLWDSTADYMRAQAAIAQIDLEVKKTNQSVDMTMLRTDIDSLNKQADRIVHAALTAATTLGSMASASRGAQNTLVGAIENTTIAASGV